MKHISAFETPDKKRFFNEDEARTHERRYDFGNLFDTAVRGNSQFARLDRELLLDLLMKHGSTIGKLADAAILPERSFTPASGRLDLSKMPCGPIHRTIDDTDFDAELDAELEQTLRGSR
jgi:hypothetical protein